MSSNPVLPAAHAISGELVSGRSARDLGLFQACGSWVYRLSCGLLGAGLVATGLVVSALV